MGIVIPDTRRLRGDAAPVLTSTNLDAAVEAFELMRGGATAWMPSWGRVDGATIDTINVSRVKLWLYALMCMYVATDDTSYLDDFQTAADSALTMLDTKKNVSDYRAQTLPAWSFDSQDVGYRMYRAYVNCWLFFPMLWFAHVVDADSLTAYDAKAATYISAAQVGLWAITDQWLDADAGRYWKDACTLISAMGVDTTGPGIRTPSDDPSGEQADVREGWNRQLDLAACYEILSRLATDGRTATYSTRLGYILDGTSGDAVSGFKDGLTLSGTKYLWAYHSTAYDSAWVDNANLGRSEQGGYPGGELFDVCWIKDNTGTTYFTSTDLTRFSNTYAGMLVDSSDPGETDQHNAVDASAAGLREWGYFGQTSQGSLAFRDRRSGWEAYAGWDASLKVLDRLVARCNDIVRFRITYIGGVRVDTIAWLAYAIKKLYG